MKKLRLKKIQRTGGGSNCINISKEAMRKLKLRAQDEECLMAEIIDEANQRLIFKKL